MRTILVSILLIVSATIHCQEKQTPFAVYEVVKKQNVNTKLIHSLKESEFIIDKDEKSPFIAFFLISTEEDALKILQENSDNNLLLLPSKQAFGENMEYKAVVAVQNKCDLNISHIKKTKAKNNKLEVYFDYQGAKIWTDYTLEVKGKLVAFTINNEVFDMTLMNAQIKTGALIISGFSDDAEVNKYLEIFNSQE